jgi:hypothetical protein
VREGGGLARKFTTRKFYYPECFYPVFRTFGYSGRIILKSEIKENSLEASFKDSQKFAF